MSRNQLKRGRELVGLCNNRNSGFTGEESGRIRRVNLFTRSRSYVVGWIP